MRRFQKIGVFTILLLGFSLAHLIPNAAVSQTPGQEENVQTAEESVQARENPPIETPVNTTVSQEAADNLTSALISLVEQLRVNNSTSGSYDKVLGFVIPVLAAFLGAVLTFLATQFTERRNWIRSQRNSLREKQFSSIANAAERIREVVSFTHRIKVTLNELIENQNANRVEAKAAIIELENRRGTWIPSIDRFVAEMALSLVELRLLNVTIKVYSNVEDFTSHLALISDKIGNLSNNVENTQVREILCLVDELDKKSEKFVHTAQVFHRSFYE